MAEIILGIDHGYGRIKTAGSNICAGISTSNVALPYDEKVLQYDGKWYEIGGSRLAYMPDKTANQNYYLLTLAGIAEEMKVRGIRSAQICLAAGLPLTRFGAEKEKFEKYLFQKKEIPFIYEGEHYHAKIISVEVSAQGYAALAYYQMTAKKPIAPVAVLADLGSGTLDVALLKNLKPVYEKTFSLPLGINALYNQINGSIFAKYGMTIEESVIDEVILGKDVMISAGYRQIIEKHARDYADMIIMKLQDLGYNLDTYPVYWCGGGATLINRYASNLNEDMNMFILEPSANALGYEYLVRLKRAQEKAAVAAADGRKVSKKKQ